jgi:hypothetical protein
MDVSKFIIPNNCQVRSTIKNDHGFIIFIFAFLYPLDILGKY